MAFWKQQNWHVARARESERGTSILEFTVAFLALMALTIGLVDMCRLMTIEMLLNKGAQDAVNLAAKIANIDNDFRNRPPSDHNYQWYVQSRRRVIMEAVRIPLASWLTDETTASASNLLPITMIDDSLDLSSLPAPVTTRGAALIRPGERVWVGDASAVGDTSKGNWVTHKKLPYTSPQTVQQAKVLLKYLPLQVEMVAEVDMIFPGLGRKTVRGTALGYREPNIPQAPLGLLPDETATVVTTTTTSATATSIPRSTTTTTVWACGAAWNNYFENTSLTPPFIGRCPIPGGTGVCMFSPCAGNIETVPF